MRSKINSLDELLVEKAKVQAQIQIAEREFNVSARRTREALETFMDNKFALPKQLSQLFQGGAQQVAGGSAVAAISRMVGMGSWWSGILSFLAPVVVTFVADRIQRRKERREAAPTEPATKAESKMRNIFKRKSAEPKADDSAS